MTTQDVREQVKELINGKVMAGPEDDPFEMPMSFNEAIRTAKGYREELGLSGDLIITVQQYCGSLGYESLEWRAFYSDTKYKSPSIAGKTAKSMLSLLRAHLESYASPESSPVSVGIPALASEQGA